MPEASVDEDRDLFRHEGDVGSARNLFVVEPVASMARVPQSLAQLDLRL